MIPLNNHDRVIFDHWKFLMKQPSLLTITEMQSFSKSKVPLKILFEAIQLEYIYSSRESVKISNWGVSKHRDLIKGILKFIIKKKKDFFWLFSKIWWVWEFFFWNLMGSLETIVTTLTDSLFGFKLLRSCCCTQKRNALIRYNSINISHFCFFAGDVVTIVMLFHTSSSTQWCVFTSFCSVKKQSMKNCDIFSLN